jgi:hypothetical protein
MRKPMRSLIVVLPVAAFVFLCILPARSAPMVASLPSIAQRHPGLVSPVASKLRYKTIIINHKRLCAWRENNGTAFGKSGFCHWSDDAPIGSSCTCERTVEHNHEVHAGSVIEAPSGSGGSSAVH